MCSLAGVWSGGCRRSRRSAASLSTCRPPGRRPASWPDASGEIDVETKTAELELALIQALKHRDLRLCVGHAPPPLPGNRHLHVQRSTSTTTRRRPVGRASCAGPGRPEPDRSANRARVSGPSTRPALISQPADRPSAARPGSTSPRTSHSSSSSSAGTDDVAEQEDDARPRYSTTTVLPGV